jgi:hypothetical protein
MCCCCVDAFAAVASPLGRVAYLVVNYVKSLILFIFNKNLAYVILKSNLENTSIFILTWFTSKHSI